MPTGKHIRLFLVEGTAGGLMTAEIMNWTGHVLRGSRQKLASIQSRPEASRTGIYILFGTDDETDERLAYIGQSDDVALRLASHHREKPFWKEVVLITSKDANLTSAHVRYLESRLVTLARRLGRVALQNSNAPTGGAELPEADLSDMEYFIEHVRILMPVLGYDIFRGRDDQSPSAASHAETVSGAPDTPAAEGDPTSSPVFWLRQGPVEARAQVIDGEFTVLAGSLVMATMGAPVRTPTAGTQKAYDRRAPDHAKLVEGAEALLGTKVVRIARDFVFSSPSAAAATALGRGSMNGRTAWVMDSGSSYGAWEAQQGSRADFNAI